MKQRLRVLLSSIRTVALFLLLPTAASAVGGVIVYLYFRPTLSYEILPTYKVYEASPGPGLAPARASSFVGSVVLKNQSRATAHDIYVRLNVKQPAYNPGVESEEDMQKTGELTLGDGSIELRLKKMAPGTSATIFFITEKPPAPEVSGIHEDGMNDRTYWNGLCPISVRRICWTADRGLDCSNLLLGTANTRPESHLRLCW